MLRHQKPRPKPLPGGYPEGRQYKLRPARKQKPSNTLSPGGFFAGDQALKKLASAALQS